MQALHRLTRSFLTNVMNLLLRVKQKKDSLHKQNIFTNTTTFDSFSPLQSKLN